MSSKKTRLEKIESALSPKQIVLLWKGEVDEAGGLNDYVVRQVRFPAQCVSDRVTKATEASLKGQGFSREAVQQAVREAFKEGAFLYHLIVNINTGIMAETRSHALQAALLAEQIRHLLEQDAVSNEMMRFYRFATTQPYPIPPEEAAAVRAMIRHHVVTWRKLGDIVDDWVRDHFTQQGKTAIPASAWKEDEDEEEDSRLDGWKLERPSDAELLEIFGGDEDRLVAFLEGKNYSHGLADVIDEEFRETAEAVKQALRDLITDGTVQAGVVAHFPTAEPPFFRTVPLIDDEWVHYYVLGQAQANAILDAKSYKRLPADDDSLLALGRIYPPGADWSKEDDLEEALVEDVSEDNVEGWNSLDKFKGRWRSIEGEDYSAFIGDSDAYLHFGDYQKWRGRKVKGKIETEEGFTAASWDAWIEANGGEGVAELAGVKVWKVRGPVRESDFVVCENRDEVIDKRWARREAISAMRDWTISKFEIEGPDFVRNRIEDGFFARVLPFDRMSYKTKVAKWRADAMTLLGEVYRTQKAVEVISKQYFDGQSILFTDTAARLDPMVEKIEEAILVPYNEMVAMRLERYRGRELLTDEKPNEGDKRPANFRAGFRIDPDEVKRLILPHIREMVMDQVNLAKAKAMDAMDEDDDAIYAMLLDPKNEGET